MRRAKKASLVGPNTIPNPRCYKQQAPSPSQAWQSTHPLSPHFMVWVPSWAFPHVGVGYPAQSIQEGFLLWCPETELHICSSSAGKRQGWKIPSVKTLPEKKKKKNSSLGLEGHPRKSDMSPQILMPTHTTSQAAAEPISLSTHHQHGARASARELSLEFSLVSYLQLQFSLTPSGKNCVQLLLKPNICMYAFLNKLSTCKYLA